MNIINNKLQLNAGQTATVRVEVDGRELDIFDVEYDTDHDIINVIAG